MIQPNELRIGNLFIDTVGAYCEANTVQKVKDINSAGVNSWRDMGISGCCFFENMEPIPLTSEILETCGFQLATTGGYYKDFEGTSILFFEKKGFFSLGYIGSQTKYLHQLQNLYFSITQEELPFNNLIIKNDI